MKRVKSYDRELGVTLNDAKTHIVHMSGGFEFLEYKIKRGSRRLALPAHKIRGGTHEGDPLRVSTREINSAL